MMRAVPTFLNALLVVAVMTSVSVGACASTEAEQAMVMFDQGIALSGKGNSADAMAVWRKMLAQYEQPAADDTGLALVRAETYAVLGEALRQSGQLDESLAAFKRVLADYPQCRSACAEAGVGVGKIYQKKGENLAAIEQYLSVITQYPERFTRAELARGRIGELMAGTAVATDLQSRITQAFASYDKVRGEDRSIKAAIATGAGKGSKADLLALVANPTVQSSYGLLMMLGNAQLAADDKINARATYQKYLEVAASELDPEGYRLARIQTSYKLGDYSTVTAEARDAASVYAKGASAIEFHYYLALGARRSHLAP
jgi:tetratricopeptide (TPR) repeat protein